MVYLVQYTLVRHGIVMYQQVHIEMKAVIAGRVLNTSDERATIVNRLDVQKEGMYMRIHQHKERQTPKYRLLQDRRSRRSPTDCFNALCCSPHLVLRGDYST